MIKLMMRSATPGLRFCGKAWRFLPDQLSLSTLDTDITAGNIQMVLQISREYRSTSNQVKGGTTLVAIPATVPGGPKNTGGSGRPK